MSYLIDALKKAERERHARRDIGLHHASAEDAPLRAGGGQRWLAAVVVLLIAINGALIFYLWHPAERENSLAGSGTTAAAVQPEPNRNRSAASTPSQPVPPGASPDSTSTGKPLPVRQTERGTSASASDRSTGAINTDPRRGQSSADTDPARPPTGANRESTQFAQRPSAAPSRGTPDHDGSHSDAAADTGRGSDLVGQSQLADVPRIRINGQLYSSVPGRSFILVDGRRYHEGQRLAAGPAVESIGPTGATLRYRGQRYHVTGPGGG